MPATGQTLTVQMIRNAVAATIVTPADSTVWSETIGKCEGTWLPSPAKSDIDNKVYVGVIGLYRRRGSVGKGEQEPDVGRIARGLLSSAHGIQIVIQSLVSAVPATRDARCDQLADFVQQVQDYWTKARRTLTITGTLTAGGTFTAEAKAFPAGPAIFGTNKLASDSVFAATMDFEFWVTEPW